MSARPARDAATAGLLLALAVAPVGCSKSQPTSVLLAIHNGDGAPVPEEVRLNVYDLGGRAFPEAHLPGQGTLVPAALPLLGTIVVYPRDPTKLRLEAHGLSGGNIVSQGTADVTAEAGRQIAADLVLVPGQLADADHDLVPNPIDNCIFVVNAGQEDADFDGVGDVCGGSDAGVRGGARNGVACTAIEGCDSHFCVDGFCCDTECTESCRSCALPGTTGTCTAIPAGQDSPEDCPMEPVSTCGRTGKCAADQTCARHPDGATCATAACAGSMQSGARTCDGAGICRPAQVVACGSYACAGLACALTCANDTACATGFFCAPPSCVPKLDVGMTCSAGNQCSSGFCADGICCMTDCSGPCKSCLLPTVGTCTAYPAGTDPDAECAQGLACTGAGACFASCAADSPDCESGYYCGGGACALKKDGGGACTLAKECKSGFCTDGVCCAEACTETCKSCNLAGNLGTCAFVANGNRDPNGPNACGPPNRCDGAGTCQ